MCISATSQPPPKSNQPKPSITPPPSIPTTSMHNIVTPSLSQLYDKSYVTHKATICNSISSNTPNFQEHNTSTNTIADLAHKYLFGGLKSLQEYSNNQDLQIMQLEHDLRCKNITIKEQNHEPNNLRSLLHIYKSASIEHPSEFARQENSLYNTCDHLITFLYRAETKHQDKTIITALLGISPLKNQVTLLKNQVSSLKKDISNLEVINYYDEVLIQSHEKLICYNNLFSITLVDTKNHCSPTAKEKPPASIALASSTTTCNIANLKTSDLCIILKGVGLSSKK